MIVKNVKEMLTSLRIIALLLIIAFVAFGCQNYKAKSVYKEGKQFADDGQYDKAIEKFQEAIKLSPNKGKYPYKLAEVYKDMKNYPEAIKWYKKAIEVEPTYYSPYPKLMQTYIKAGDKKSALDVGQKALKIVENQDDSKQEITDLLNSIK